MTVSEKMEAIKSKREELCLFPWDTYAEQCEKALSTPQGWVNPIRCPRALCPSACACPAACRLDARV